MSSFPIRRPRRLRQSAEWRRLVRETPLTAADFVYPLFVVTGEGTRQPIASMPSIFRHSPDALVAEASAAAASGVGAVILFGVPEATDPLATGAADPNGAVAQGVRALKAALPELLVWTDVCLCSYTDHGHCGLVDRHGAVVNDDTLPVLARAALMHAEAGADAVAPSDMMDGRIGHLRQALDQAGHSQLPIIAYAAKFASAFYGPFREAAQSAPAFGDRRSYQLDPGNAREALAELQLDIDEGADIVMIKPALAYLDIVRQARDRLSVPIAAYQVSGEYSMIKAAAAAGWLDERQVAMESLLSIKRAGADLILTYYARQAADWLAA